MQTVDDAGARLRKALYGNQKEKEKEVLEIVINNDLETRLSIAKYYEAVYSTPLQEDLKAKLNPHFRNLVMDLFLSPVDYDVQQLKTSFKGFSIDEGVIFEILTSRSYEMLQEINKLYKVQNGKEVYDSLDFSEINFNGNSSEESQSLQQNTKTISSTVSLKDAEASVDKTTLKLKGTFDPSNKLTKGTTVPLSILTETSSGDNENIEYDCTVKSISPGELDCDTSSNLLKTTVQNLHLSTGTTSDNTLVTVYMKDYNRNSTDIITTGSSNRYTYNKSSSGLSGGAIAGIVIACIAVLLAASIAAIMLRKPAPPIDNTTVVGLKTVENV